MDPPISTFEWPLDQDAALIEAATRTINILQELNPRLKSLDHREARRYSRGCRMAGVAVVISCQKHQLRLIRPSRHTDMEMGAFAAYVSLTSSTLQTALACLKRNDIERMLVELDKFFEEARLVSTQSLQMSSGLSGYQALLQNILTTVEQRQQAIEQRAKTLQQTIVVFPTFLANRSSALFKFSAVATLWKHQSHISASNALYSEKQSSSHRFDKKTIDILTESFNVSPTPSPKELAVLKSTTRLTEKQISMWFTNRRCRSKRAKTTKSAETARQIQDSDCSRSEAGTWSPSESLATPPLTVTEPQSIPQRIISFHYSSEDDFFANSRQEAEVEFYQTMFGQSGRYNWLGFDSYPFTGGR